jgi:hypothetical protein
VTYSNLTEREMKTNQEYGSELNAVCFAFSKARQTEMPWYAVETAYGWVESDRKPSMRFGKVWECHPNGQKCHG